MELTADSVLSVLGGIRHPEGQAGIVELGLVEVNGVDASGASLDLTIRPLGGRHDPFLRSLHRRSRKLLEHYWPDAKIEIGSGEALHGAESSPSEEGASSGGVGGVDSIVAIASGKGGVGKSTVTVNLGVTLARKGYSVGIVDADVFGPSLPMMLGLEGYHPEVERVGDHELLIPAEAYGVKLLSMGFFVSREEALIWRGPMASNAFRQLLDSACWGELDFLLLDLPPGTSDIHLTTVQQLALTGAVIVTTPQAVAVADARKGIRMFRTPDVNVPILGLVENMAWFEPAELPGHRYYLFGKGGGVGLAGAEGIPFLGQLPLIQSVCESGDYGSPVAASDSPAGAYFETLAENFLEELAERKRTLPPTRRVEVSGGK